MADYNNYSKQLQEILQRHRPKEGNKFVFESLEGSTNLPKTDTIVDPGTGNKINIAIVKGYRPNKNEESNRADIPIIEMAALLKSSGDKILIQGGKPDDMDKFDYLFLCRWNKDNIDKKWHIKPDGNKYRFKSSDVQRKVEESVNKRERILEAQNIIRGFNEEQAKAVMSKISTKFNEMSLNQIKENLYKLAESDPEKASGKKIDIQSATKVFIDELQNNGILKKAQMKWVMVNEGGDDETIISFSPKQNASQLLIDFLKSDQGEEVKDLLQKRLKEEASGSSFFDRILGKK